MTAQPKHGHDGHAPEFMPTRDLESIDRWTGQRRREVVDGPTNINIDRIEWLFNHQQIESEHHQAARRLQRDHQVGLIMPMAQSGGVAGGGGRSDYTPAQVKIDASRRYALAVNSLGEKAGPLVKMVVIDEISPEKAAGSLGINAKRALGRLEVGLDILAQFYREYDREHGRNRLDRGTPSDS